MSVEIIQNKIAAIYPNLDLLLSQIEPISLLKPASGSVLDAVSQVVVGQMLSRKAAKAIIDRCTELSKLKNLSSVALLSENDLKNCGLSWRKIKTIQLFAQYYQDNIEKVENWRNLNTGELYKQVNDHWGLSNWSASMLGIFYFGKENIFPYEDGSIKRALSLLHEANIPINPELILPQRSYLALYLWKLLDSGLLKQPINEHQVQITHSSKNFQ